MTLACFIGIVLCVVLIAIIKGLVLFFMAKKSLFFTFVPEGQIVIAVQGGQAKKYFGNIKGFWVNPKTGQVVEEEMMSVEQIEQRETDERNKNFIFRILEYKLGLHWIGLWPFFRRYEYKFKWNKWARKAESSEYELIPRDEVVNSLYFRFTYPIKIDNVETRGKVPLNTTVLVNTRITHADRALFKTGDWLGSLTGAVTAVIRDFIGSKELEEITTLTYENSDSGLFKQIMLLNDSSIGNPSLDEMFGVVVDSVNFVGYEISGEDGERLRKASTEKYVATQEAEAKIAKATGDAEAMVTDANARATSIEKVAEANAKAIKLEGDALAKIAKKKKTAMGMHPDVAMAEAIKETKVKTLIFGSGVLPTMPLEKEE